MGSSGSKNCLRSEIEILKKSELDSSNKLKEKSEECNRMMSNVEKQKSELESRHAELEIQYLNLQNEFLSLKSSFEAEELSGGDYVAHSNYLDRKLQAALSESEVIPEKTFLRDDAEIGACMTNIGERFNDDIKTKFHMLVISHQKAIEQLENDERNLLEENCKKDVIIQNMKEEIEKLRNHSEEEEKHKFEVKLKEQELVMYEKYKEEKRHITELWEDKLNQALIEYKKQIEYTENSAECEKVSLEDKLAQAMNDIDMMVKKYALLNKLFVDIRTRYELRASRNEDLERIADLEAQLIIQSEELEKQRNLFQALKLPPQNEVNQHRNRRSRRAFRKQQKTSESDPGDENFIVKQNINNTKPLQDSI